MVSRIKAAVQAVLDARLVHQTAGVAATLAQLNDPSLMPASLANAHGALDKAVDDDYWAMAGLSAMPTMQGRSHFCFNVPQY